MLGAITRVLSDISPVSVLTGVVRWASKKAGGSSRNPKGHRPGKRRGIKEHEGSYVSAGSILVRQLGVRFHPGLNVGIGRDGSLYAMEAGRVIVSCEKFRPNFDNFWTNKAYGARKEMMSNVYKKYFHIIPFPQEGRFKLVDQI